MSIQNLYSPEEQAQILTEIEALKHEASRTCINPRYFSGLAERYQLVEKLEEEIDLYQRGELGDNGPTSDSELAEFFGVHRFSIQRFLEDRMDLEKKYIKGEICLSLGQLKGWEHLRDSGKIPPLKGRVRNLAIRAIKRKWGKI